mmetsp:Transcript_49028/g.156807  ORF Transcript_49028/g.156807 Transcript_49028/m.156807 type:complete len:293 (+) Transcript_49028:810-1688(+)
MARPRLEHSALRSLAERPSQRLTSRRLCRSCSRSPPPKTPRRWASLRSSCCVQRFQRSSSGRLCSAARCASADLASAMTKSARPLRNSESCSARPCSVRSAILRQEPRCESRTMSFFMSQIVALLETVISRSSPVMACRNVTCTGHASSSSSGSGAFSACSSKTCRTLACFAPSSRAESPPAPQRRMSAPRSSSNLQSSASPSIAASISGVVSCESPRSPSAPAFMSARTSERRLSSPVPAISRTTSSKGVSPSELAALASAFAETSTLTVSSNAELSKCTGGAMIQRCSKA